MIFDDLTLADWEAAKLGTIEAPSPRRATRFWTTEKTKAARLGGMN